MRGEKERGEGVEESKGREGKRGRCGRGVRGEKERGEGRRERKRGRGEVEERGEVVGGVGRERKRGRGEGRERKRGRCGGGVRGEKYSRQEFSRPGGKFFKWRDIFLSKVRGESKGK